MFCKRHGENYKKPKEKVKIGRYSGKSKTPYGRYEER